MSDDLPVFVAYAADAPHSVMVQVGTVRTTLTPEQALELAGDLRAAAAMAQAMIDRDRARGELHLVALRRAGGKDDGT